MSTEFQNARQNLIDRHFKLEHRDYDGHLTDEYYCADDIDDWPCDVYVILEHLDNLEQEAMEYKLYD